MGNISGMRISGRRARNAAVLATIAAATIVVTSVLISVSSIGVFGFREVFFLMTTVVVVWVAMWAVGMIWFSSMVGNNRYRKRGEAGPKMFETVVRYDHPPELLQQIAESAIRDLLRENPNYSVIEEAPRFISVETPLNIWSFGESITMYVEGASIRVRSECLTGQLIDWGRNRANVERACHSLLQASSAAL